jgi:hypothetical protein
MTTLHEPVLVEVWERFLLVMKSIISMVTPITTNEAT